MAKKMITYQDEKDFVYDGMNGQKPHVNPISYGSSFIFDYSMHSFEELEFMMCFIACGLYELEHNDLEERIEEQMTYWIYQYKKGMFRDQIVDKKILEKDIQKIESMIKLRFEDLECYETIGNY